MTATALALWLVAATASGFARPIVGTGSGPAVVALDPHVYEHARADLGDLRIEDEGGRGVPFLILRAASGPAQRLSPRILNRGFTPKKSATATLDFGGRVSKRKLHLSLSGASFRRRVVVEGGDDGARWSTLVDGAYVFAVPGTPGARFETVDLPENDHPLLRLTIENDRDDPPKIEIADAFVEASAEAPLERVLAARMMSERDTSKKQTLLTFDLGAAGQPISAVQLDVATPRFFRGALVEAPGGGDDASLWPVVGEGGVYRYGTDASRKECLRLPAATRAASLRVRIFDGDDAPLEIRRASVLALQERLVFEADDSERYVLTYGDPSRTAPAFDLAKTVPDANAWAAQASRASLDAPVPRVLGAPPPWTERHPALLAGGLVAVVAILGLLTYRALSRAS